MVLLGRNSPVSLNELKDVDVTTANADQILVYNKLQVNGRTNH